MVIKACASKVLPQTVTVPIFPYFDSIGDVELDSRAFTHCIKERTRTRMWHTCDSKKN